MRSILTSIALFVSVSFSFAQSSANGTLNSVVTSLEGIETITLKYTNTEITTEVTTYRGVRLTVETVVTCPKCSEGVKTYLQGLYAPVTTVNGNSNIIVAPKKAVQPLYIKGEQVKFEVEHKIIVPETMFNSMK